MTARHVGRTAMFAFVLGIGLLLASGAVAAAAPEGGSGSAAASSAPHTGKPSAARGSSARAAHVSAGPITGPAHSGTRTAAARQAAQPKITQPTQPRLTVVTSAPAAQQVARQTPAGLPTPAQVQQAVVAALDGMRRELDAARRNIETAVARQVYVAQQNLTSLSQQLARLFGIAGKPTPPPPTPSDTDVIHGTLDNKKFWQASTPRLANLAAVAMVLGYYTGTMPSFEDLVQEAETTASIERANRNMYLGPDTNDWLWTNDAAQLLQTHGVQVTGKFYSGSDGVRALATVTSELDQSRPVIAIIRSDVPGVTAARHMVVIVAIDTTTDEVVYNDAAFGAEGQGKVMLRADFVKMWDATSFEMVMTQLAPVNSQSDSAADQYALAA